MLISSVLGSLLVARATSDFLFGDTSLGVFDCTVGHLIRLFEGGYIHGWILDVMARFVRDVAPSRVLVGFAAWTRYELRLDQLEATRKHPDTTVRATELIELLAFGLGVTTSTLVTQHPDLYQWHRLVHSHQMVT